MKLKFSIKTCLFVLTALVAGNVQAAIVDFEEFANGTPGTGNLGLSSLFSGATTTPGSQQRLEQVDLMGNPLQTFGDANGISFSGGVLLQMPTETMNFGNTGAVLYGTANSPTTQAVTNPPGELPRTITINIDTSVGENITLVEGFLVNGLNTDRIDPNTMMPFTDQLADYLVSFFTIDDVIAEFEVSLDNLASNLAGGSAFFSFNSLTQGSGNNITRVEITSPGIDFLANTDDVNCGQGVFRHQYQIVLNMIF